jgi:hypothetical protein
MTHIEALITIARRYCMDNHFYWYNKYIKERTGNDFPYTDNDYNLFPRYNVLGAILQGVESLVGQAFPSIHACKLALKHIGFSSQNASTKGKHNIISDNAMEDERNKFTRFIDRVTTHNLDTTEPLPYRRKIKQEEAAYIRQQLFETWNYDGDYWEPLFRKSPKPTIFLMHNKLTEIDIKEITKCISARASKNIFEISEDQIDYEITVDSFDPELYETISCDNSFEWVIYGSHEGTIAFGGTWLIEVVQQLFADRAEELNKWDQS